MTNSKVFIHFDDKNADVIGARVNKNKDEMVIKTIGLVIAIISMFFSILWVSFRYKKLKSSSIITKTRYD